MYDIETIFYFTDSTTYRSMQGKISPRTIVFVSDERAIYKDGVRYGTLASNDPTIINTIESNKYTLPVATAIELGGIKVGNYLTINSDGVLSVNYSSLWNKLLNDGLMTHDWYNDNKYDDSDVWDAIHDAQDGISTANGLIDDLSDRITGIITEKKEDIEGMIDDALSEYEWLKKNLGDVFAYSGFVTELNAFLTTVGLLDQNGNAGWSSLIQDVNSITGRVVNLENGQFTENQIKLWISDGVSGIDLTSYITSSNFNDTLVANTAWLNMISRLEGAENTLAAWSHIEVDGQEKTILELYSGLKQTVDAMNGSSSLDLSTYVQKTELDTLVKNISGLILNTNLDSSVAQLFASTSSTKTAVEGIVSNAGFLAQTDLESATAQMFASWSGSNTTLTPATEHTLFFDEGGSTQASVTLYSDSSSATHALIPNEYYSRQELADGANLYTSTSSSAMTLAEITTSLETLPVVVADKTDTTKILGHFIACPASEGEMNKQSRGNSSSKFASLKMIVDNNSSEIALLSQAVTGQLGGTSGLITESNIDSAFADVFASTTQKAYLVSDVENGSTEWTNNYSGATSADIGVMANPADSLILVDVNYDDTLASGSAEVGTYVTALNGKYYTLSLLETTFGLSAGTLPTNQATIYVKYVPFSGDAYLWRIDKNTSIIQTVLSQFTTKADLNNAYAEMMATNGSLEAKIQAAIVDNKSWIKMIADNVDIKDNSQNTIAQMNSSTISFLDGKIYIPVGTNNMQGTPGQSGTNTGWIIEDGTPNSLRGYYQQDGFNIQSQTGVVYGAVSSDTNSTALYDFAYDSTQAATDRYDDNIKIVLDSDFDNASASNGATGTGYCAIERNTHSGSNSGLLAFGGWEKIISNVTINATSDERLKNFTETECAVEDIANTRIVDYTFKNSQSSTPRLGAIAQDWQKVFPNAVPEGEDGYLSLDYSAVALASAVVDAREIVKLKEENAQLKARLAVIELKLGIV